MIRSPESLRFFVSCAPGLEMILAQELKALNLTILEPEPATAASKNRVLPDDPGGWLLSGSLEDVYRSNLYLRTASRVSVRLGEFYAAAFSELRKKASRLEWERYLSPGQPVHLSVTCHKSRLYHSDAVAERVVGAINDRFSNSKKETQPSKNGQLVLVRLVNDLCTISIDSSGALLHKRGYRLESTKAPLRETLAAALLLLSGWSGEMTLIDPFCGSGTIPIEAALLARNIPPGVARDFAFMHWPGFVPHEWERVLHSARDGIIRQDSHIFGYDRDQGAVQSAISNASRAGLNEVIHFQRQSISELSPPRSNPGWLITNPPYGVRISGSKDLRNLYARFGNLLTTAFSQWQAGILCYDKKLTANLGLPPQQASYHFTNGGLPVDFNVFAF
ncbi:MAG TPA: class I SAM-dependent RNA methyltransferase [Anaerolineaceae bacterium]|nr:class I SAM-dependent RNA methyltransferase [Anaerolineaceae bacterium]